MRPAWRRALLVALVGVVVGTGPVVSARAGGVGGDDDADGYVAGGSLIVGDTFDGGAAERAGAGDCPGCRWRYRTVCRPGDIVGEGSCAAASAGCPAGSTRVRLDVYRDSAPWWRDIGTVCLGPDVGPVPVDDVATEVRDEVEKLLPVLRPRTQPGSRTLTALPTVLLAGQPRGVGPLVLDVLGLAVRVSADPRWKWDFGDGTAVTTADPGSAWPTATLTHRFRRPGQASVTVTTTWAATFTVDGLGPYPVPAPAVTQTATLTLTVVEARAHLVR